MKICIGILSSLFATMLAVSQTTLPPQSGLPASVLYGSAAPSTVYTCDLGHPGQEYDQITAAGAMTPYACVSVSGTATWLLKPAGSINGGSIPVSATLLGTNSQGQLIPSTLTQPCAPIENVATAAASPAFNGNDCLNSLTLSTLVTGFTIPAPTVSSTAAHTCLLFVQSSTLAITAVTPPSNYIGFLAISTALGKRNMQCATWSPSLALWVAESAGVVGH